MVSVTDLLAKAQEDMVAPIGSFDVIWGGKPLANHKSAEKRARQAVKRNARNTQTVTSVRTFERKLRTALAAGDKKGAEAALKEYMSKAAKAATKGAMHARTAARKVGRLAKQVSKAVSK